ncbi:hypothetical protein L453_09584, partial [Escherichia coli BIDMC 19B]
YMKYFLYQIVPIAAIISAAILALKGINGWGWFLTVGFLLAGADTVKAQLSK